MTDNPNSACMALREIASKNADPLRAVLKLCSQQCTGRAVCEALEQAKPTPEVDPTIALLRRSVLLAEEAVRLAGALHGPDALVGSTPSDEKKVLEFTDREKEIIGLICEGFGRKRITRYLDISSYFVNSFIECIISKMNRQGMNIRKIKDIPDAVKTLGLFPEKPSSTGAPSAPTITP